jgi:hypothetical protein
MMDRMNRGAWRWAVLCAVVLLSACSTKVTSTMAPTAQPVTMLPRPNMIVVDDFAVDPSVVRVDSGIGGTVRRAISGTDTAQEQAQQAANVSRVLRDSLIGQIYTMNLPARSPALGPVAPPYVEVRGTLTSIDEGNQTRRTIIGLGAGKSDVQASVALYYVAPGAPPALIQSYDGNANSGRMPGLAVGGAGAAAGHVGMAAANGTMNVATAGHGDADADAQHLAKDLAAQLGAVFAQEGWIPASSVPSVGLR